MRFRVARTDWLAPLAPAGSGLPTHHAAETMRRQIRPTLGATVTTVTTVTTATTVASAALLVAVSAWSAHLLLAPLPRVDPAVRAVPAALDATGGAALFGAAPDQANRGDVQLLGLLAFDPHHAAAIVSVGGEAARVVRVNGAIGNAATLAEVRSRSIVVEHNGVRREIALPTVDSPNAFVR